MRQRQSSPSLLVDNNVKRMPYSGNASISYLKANRVDSPSALLILGDSRKGSENRQNHEFRNDTKNHANQGTVHMRHLDKMNALFLDGRVDQLSGFDIQTYGIHSYADSENTNVHFN